MTQGRCPDDEGSGVDPPILIVGCDSILIGVSFHLVRDTSAGLSRALSVVPAGIPVIICTGLSSTVILYMKCAPPKENVGVYKFISASSKKICMHRFTLAVSFAASPVFFLPHC